MVTNKQLLKDLTEYFMEQDKETVCRALAGSLLDIYRIRIIHLLPEAEALNLKARVEQNVFNLKNFAKGVRGEFGVVMCNSTEGGDE